MFDSLNFTSDAGKSLGSMATGAASSLTSGKMLNTVSGLSKSGLSLDGIKSISASKLDSLSNSLNPDTNLLSNFARVDPKELVSGRSDSQTRSGDPATAIRVSQEQQKTSVLEYPLSRDTYIDFMNIKFAKYVRPSAVDRGTFNTEMEIRLPLPFDLRDTHSVRVNAQATTALGAVANQIESIGNEVLGNTDGSSMKDLLVNAGGLGYYMIKSSLDRMNPLGMSGEQISDMIGQEIGAIPNPHISLFFNGVDIRGSIEFSWVFTPRNPAESQRIKEIIQQFKKRTLPPVTNGAGNIMGYPNMVEIELHPWANYGEGKTVPQTMPIYKRGLIESINVNYTPNRISLFKDNNPTFIVFTFLFQEIEVFTAKDFGGDDYDAGQIASKLTNKVNQFEDAFSPLTSVPSPVPRK